MTAFVEVALPLPLDQFFTYSVPEDLRSRLQVGMRVMVPFRDKTLTAFVLRVMDEPPANVPGIKPVASLLDDEPLFSSSFLEFMIELSRLSFAPLGELLEAALPPGFVVRERISYFLKKVPTPEEIKAGCRGWSTEAENIIHLFYPDQPRSLTYLQRKIRNPRLPRLLNRLEKMGWIVKERRIISPAKRKRGPAVVEAAQLALSFPLDPEVEPALEKIHSCLDKGRFSPFLLVGSRSRREAFFLRLLQRWGTSAGNILILLPEVAASFAFWEKALGVFGSRRIALLHGNLSQRRRETAWRKIWSGEIDVVVGTRSTVFAPLPRIRLLLIDEEQDDSYIHESPRYDAREAAWLRATQEGAVIILGSSAPSVSLYSRAKERGFLIPIGRDPGPPGRMVTFSLTGRSILSPDLREAIAERLWRKEKIFLLLNRRGFASILSCPRCGAVALCSRCSRPLTLHLQKNELVCHHCRLREPRWSKCPQCGSRVIEGRGLGVEALAEEVCRLFPQARVRSLDAETARGKQKMARILKDFYKGRLDLLVGTQFLISHLNLDQVSLVGLLHPEIALGQADFRSGEKVFQLIRRLQDMIGCSFRTEFLIQTAIPDHYVLRASARGDWEDFVTSELRFRRLLGLPPWMVLVHLYLWGDKLRQVARQARELVASLQSARIAEEILGPATLPRIRGKPAVQIIIKAKKKEEIISSLSDVLKKMKIQKRVEVFS